MRSIGRILIPCLLAACSAPDSTSTVTEDLGVSTIDSSNGFPIWYGDALDTRVVACLDARDPNCVILPDAGFDPALPLRFPDNFPGEFFYTVVDSDKVATPGCPVAGIPAGRAFVRTALEGSFVSGLAVAGGQIVFARIRIVASGLCPNTRYAFTHPHGVEFVTTNAAGAVPANAATEDIGCLAAPCNFTAAVASRVFTNYLRWDPAVPPAAPPGYLGDAVTLHPVIGGVNRVFSIADPAGAVVASTPLFTVSGKLAGPLLAAPAAVEFGGQVIATPSAPIRITITNVAAAVTPGAPTISGLDAGDFAITSNACSGASLAKDASCTIAVAFTPSATVRRSASLTLISGGPLPLIVGLTGTGISPGAAPALALDTAALAFTDQRVGTASAPKIVTVKNTGNAPLGVPAVAVVGASPGEFTIVDDRCTGKFIDAGSSCSVAVAFAPHIAAAAAAALQISDNAPGAPHAVALSGTGFGGYATLATGLDGNGFPSWYQDEAGLQTLPCLQQVVTGGVLAADPLCVLLADATFNPALPLAFPTNFPGEFFYHLADSDKIVTPGCPASGIAPGRALVRMAVEGSFATGVPIPGDQISFSRTRFAVTGLCPLTSYRVIYPYGSQLVTTDSGGASAGHFNTTDIGCAGAPCAFAEALRGANFAGFLHWDAAPPAPPAGYLGDPTVLHTVTGATYVPPGASQPANFVRIEDLAGNVMGQTASFLISGKQGELVYAPAPLAFGARAIGSTTSPMIATVTNVAAATVVVGAVTLGGANPADFALDARGCAGAALLPGKSCTLSAAFTPAAAGARSASATLTHNGAVASPLSVIFAGIGGTPAVALAPTALTFGDQIVATESAPMQIGVTDVGSAPLTIAGVSLIGANAASYQIVGDACTGHVLAAGTSCLIDVVFAPGATGVAAAALAVNDDAAGAPQTVELRGAGVALSSALSVSPASLAFGDQTVAIASARRRVTLSNTGAAQATIWRVSATGVNAADLAIAADGCSGSTLAAGEACTFDAAFRPVAAGARTATIAIASPSGQLSIAVTGNGVVPAVATAPSGLAFPIQAANTTSAARSLVVTNTGAGLLRITAAALGGVDAASFRVTSDTCTGASVAPAASCTIQVAFRPTGDGARNAQLRLTDNTAAGQEVLSLVGTGSAPRLVFSVSPLGFGVIRVGSNSTKSFNIINSGSQSLSVGLMTMLGANAAEFTVTRNQCTAAIAPGRNCTVNVTFAPRALGTRNATLSIASNDPATPSALPIEGTTK